MMVLLRIVKRRRQRFSFRITCLCRRFLTRSISRLKTKASDTLNKTEALIDTALANSDPSTGRSLSTFRISILIVVLRQVLGQMVQPIHLRRLSAVTSIALSNSLQTSSGLKKKARRRFLLRIENTQHITLIRWVLLLSYQRQSW